MFELISKLSFAKGTQLALIILGNLIAPYMFIFQFAPKVYESNEVIKLVILCISIGVPISLFNLFLELTREKIQGTYIKKDQDALWSMMGSVSFSTAAILYITSTAPYLVGNMSLKSGIQYAIWAQVGIIFASAIIGLLITTAKTPESKE